MKLGTVLENVAKNMLAEVRAAVRQIRRHSTLPPPRTLPSGKETGGLCDQDTGELAEARMAATQAHRKHLKPAFIAPEFLPPKYDEHTPQV